MVLLFKTILMKGRRKWTRKEIAFLKRNYKKMTHSELALALNRSVKAVSFKLYQLRLIKTKPKRGVGNKTPKYLRDLIDKK